MNYVKLAPCNLLNPVPVVLVSCRAPEKGSQPNLITVAWAGTVNSDPPMVSVSIRPGRYSHDLIRDSGEFVVNLTDRKLCKATDLCGVKSGRDTDKFRLAGLKPMPAPEMTFAPAVEGTPVAMSCKVRQILPLGSHDLFLGQVTGVLVRQDLLDERNSLHLEKADLLVYNHGLYQRVTDVLGFFGYSVAEEKVLKKRMKNYR